MENKLHILQEMHYKLMEYKYFYYIKHESLVTDYEFDMLEKEYSKLAKELNIKDIHSASEAVGEDLRIRLL